MSLFGRLFNPFYCCRCTNKNSDRNDQAEKVDQEANGTGVLLSAHADDDDVPEYLAESKSVV